MRSIVLAAILVLEGCTPKPAMEAEAESIPAVEARPVIASDRGYDTVIVTDTNGCQYLQAEGAHAVAITPRLAPDGRQVCIAAAREASSS